MEQGDVRRSYPDGASVQEHPGSLRRGTTVDLWIDLVSDLIVAEVLREQQVEPVEHWSDRQSEEAR